jgi:methionyl-tRNA formyltransferase
MKIAVFTSNQPRHLSLIEKLSTIADQVIAVQECNTVFPGQVEDFFHKSPVMQKYFSKVIAAEKEIFGSVAFSATNVSSLSIKMGDLNSLDISVFKAILDADLIIVFGASWIRPPLIEALETRRAVNIHMGVSPYYRGSSCNFWALYDGNPAFVGSTIHRLRRGLDNGGIYFHTMPPQEPTDPFILGMKAVKAAHNGLLASIVDQSIFQYDEIAQDRDQEIRYTKNLEFTDQVAEEYLRRDETAKEIESKFNHSPPRELVRPRFD